MTEFEKGEILKNRKSNKLINEKSPYLLQHANNPVDWYPWGDEAFEKAKKEDKPIFLSIGYSTCHWCHVMEKESFEDNEVAKLLNDSFISIKVDREERPDIDSVYMNVCQMITGGGGWPLTIMMDHNKTPFFAATYIPKKNRFKSIGLLELIPRIKFMWEKQREDLNKIGNNIQLSLNSLSVSKKTFQTKKLDNETFTMAYKNLKSNFDSKNGGFGRAPKFPTPQNIVLLIRCWRRTGDKNALLMVEKTLDAMNKGGIYDHVGFGFHRYSTDAIWLAPHFEKMLYDQALISIAYIEAFQATKKEIYKKIAEEIFAYVSRDMTSKEGGFYSAEDADSEGEEGKFYLWTYHDLKKILLEDEITLVSELYNIQKDGNYVDPIVGKKTGSNILHKNISFEDLVKRREFTNIDIQEKLELIRKKLFSARIKRPRPLKDDKILTDWNGLMISALAKGGRALSNQKYIDTAIKAADFMISEMIDENGNLYHRYRIGERKICAFLDDYSFFIWGLIELYQATFKSKYLKTAIDLSKRMISDFWDSNSGGFYLTSKYSEDVLVKTKKIYDGAIPSGNSIALHVLILLGKITSDSKYLDLADMMVNTFSNEISSYPLNYIQMLNSIDIIVNPSYEVIVVGDINDDDTKEFINSINSEYLPNTILIHRPIKFDEELNILGEYIKNLQSIDGKATAYICKNYKCEIPTTNINKMIDLLKK